MPLLRGAWLALAGRRLDSVSLASVGLPEFGYSVSWLMYRNGMCPNFGRHCGGPQPGDAAAHDDCCRAALRACRCAGSPTFRTFVRQAAMPKKAACCLGVRMSRERCGRRLLQQSKQVRKALFMAPQFSSPSQARQHSDRAVRLARSTMPFNCGRRGGRTLSGRLRLAHSASNSPMNS